jgi:hypothetical protein
VLDSFIPSAKRWLARFRRSDLGDRNSVVDSSAAGKNFILAELSPSDGRIERLFKIDSGSLFNIACEADGRLISYSTGQAFFSLAFTDIPIY